jgi:hypothetical protein
LTRYDVVQKFLSYLSLSRKISEDQLLANGVVFFGEYGYVISKSGVGRIRVDDRVLPASAIMWDDINEMVIDAPPNIVAKIRRTSFLKRSLPSVFVKRSDLIGLIKDLTPKRENKSRVVLDIGEEISGATIRKNEVISKKKFLAHKNNGITGKIEFNLFDFKKTVLEFFSDYDIIGIQISKNPIMFGRRLDKTKPAVDFVFKEGCYYD